MRPLEIRSEMVTVLSAILLSLCLRYLQENRELAMGNGIISVGGWRSGWQTDFESARMLPLEIRPDTVIVLLSAIHLSLCLHHPHEDWRG